MGLQGLELGDITFVSLWKQDGEGGRRREDRKEGGRTGNGIKPPHLGIPISVEPSRFSLKHHLQGPPVKRVTLGLCF